MVTDHPKNPKFDGRGLGSGSKPIKMVPIRRYLRRYQRYIPTRIFSVVVADR